MGIEYVGDIIYNKRILKSCRIVIFGTGICGKRIAGYLIKKGVKDHIICFCDSNCDLEGCNIMEIPICNPIEVCRNYPDADYLISGKYSREMYEILKENHIDRIHILVI